MKMTVMSKGRADPHQGWAAIEEFAELLVQIFDAQWVSPTNQPRGWMGRSPFVSRRPRFSPLPNAAEIGGDVLFVVAGSPADLAMVGSIPDARKRFARIHAFVTDSYFEHGFVRETALFDSITVTAKEDVAYPRDRFGIAVHHLHQGADVLRWAPRSLDTPRAIDLIAYGRTPASYHEVLCDRYHRMDSDALYLHSPLGNLTGPTVARERSMLFKLLHRTHISLAFHLLVEVLPHRPVSMMVTSRWLESLASGCIVAGRRPVSTMADDMLCWDGATIELSEDPRIAADEIDDLIARKSEFTDQRRCNIANMFRHHDWRWRISELCALHGWARPERLESELAAVVKLSQDWA
ncbi:glycosyltransferase [Sphingobium subterraneum]|uniref:Spore protein YkvP/CgeB glycosyl transferase-like domain-containing protein n=1 Tax=Sphingobium subterraneum TaxID=627688 RepID=A0A841IY61_9SPHN|nr:glycosyltransferase [Sphingobium subterraneum]MBB6123250.1 hypothetical protein [Sphingobium subterraneum]